jgi:FkbM family methyltransferase
MARAVRSHLVWSWTHSALAAGLRSRAWLFLALSALPMTHRVLPGVAIPARLRLAGRPRRFWFSDASQVFALEDIFVRDEYGMAGRGRPEVIVDLGANAGQAALWFRSRFPDARLLCVEPDPRTFAMLERNLGGDPLVTLVRAAVTAENGPVGLRRTPDSSWGTTVGGGAEDARGVTLETLLDEHGLDEVDLLKVDIEGLEHEALRASPALARAAMVVGELHPGLLAVGAERALEDLRHCGGFERAGREGDIFVLTRGAGVPAQT